MIFLAIILEVAISLVLLSTLLMAGFSFVVAALIAVAFNAIAQIVTVIIYFYKE